MTKKQELGLHNMNGATLDDDKSCGLNDMNCDEDTKKDKESAAKW